MQINNHLIKPNAMLTTGKAAALDAGAAFAGRLERAINTSEHAGKKQRQSKAAESEEAKLKKACQEMEAVFLNMMLSRMRATVPKTSLLGNGSQEEIIQSLLDTELTKNMAQAGGMGLGAMLYRQLSKNTVTGQVVR